MNQRRELRREAQEWVVRLTSGRATLADAEALRAWCSQTPAHGMALAEAGLLWDKLAPVARSVARRSMEGVPARSPVGLGRRAFLGGAMAASAAVAGYLTAYPPLGLWPSLSEWAADYRTGTGERRQLAIGGGISVEMNTRTSLAIKTEAGASRRLELISGELAVATSEAEAKPLVVAAGGGTAIATNAKFDVRCEDAKASVACLAGSVHVEYRNQAVTLGARQEVVYGEMGMRTPVSIDPASVSAWRDGRLVFRGEALARVIDEVNRYRRDRIILMNSELGRRPVEATLLTDQTDELVKLVQKAYGAKVTSLPGGIVVLS